jgi:hypothetical protein
MELVIQIKEKDYLHYAFMHVRKWKGNLFYLVVFGTCLLMGTWSLGNSANKPIGFDRIIGIVLFSLIFFYGLVLMMLYFKLKSEYVVNKHLKEISTFRFDANGFTVQTSMSNATMDWNNVVKVKQSKRVVAIYISHNQAYIFPKDQLDDVQRSALYDHLKKHLPENKFKYPRLS